MILFYQWISWKNWTFWWNQSNISFVFISIWLFSNNLFHYILCNILSRHFAVDAFKSIYNKLSFIEYLHFEKISKHKNIYICFVVLFLFAFRRNVFFRKLLLLMWIVITQILIKIKNIFNIFFMFSMFFFFFFVLNIL